MQKLHLYHNILFGGNVEKTELVVMALQQRIGELVSSYETQIAILRAEITQLVKQSEDKENAAEKYAQEIAEKIGIES